MFNYTTLCGESYIDNAVYPIVQNLNRIGVQTRFSCSGHPEHFYIKVDQEKSDQKMLQEFFKTTSEIGIFKWDDDSSEIIRFDKFNDNTNKESSLKKSIFV